ncbi:hypothetical protein [Dubosiella newyorkensis]|jgi:hypothetical protein|uniref:Uncharacterized protein n=1 Tax=Dubosiella newyorkensis TaxID=1862672 RepID=A0A1U7NQJ5_9FIRM|nr:hypothetical protein [Dubosiella newyorkensis]MCI9040513.1 hypothetical protein [Dubosiella newyorkensis]OLU47905.1 hypothetical protein BO225_00800 [Dubosiella newyorkensis]
MEQTCLLDLKNENLSLVVTLSDIDSEKTMKYILLLLKCVPVFEKLQLSVRIYTLQPQADMDRIAAVYQTNFLWHESKEMIEALGAYKTKVVFGKKREIVYSYLFLFHDDRLVKMEKRISKTTLFALLQMAIKIRSKEFLKKLENMFDNFESL